MNEWVSKMGAWKTKTEKSVETSDKTRIHLPALGPEMPFPVDSTMALIFFDTNCVDGAIDPDLKSRKSWWKRDENASIRRD